MFESHFGLRENPFVAAHQARYIYPSPEHQEAIAHLRYGIENREPFVLITGEVGTGKTTALYDALSEWQGRAIVGLITNSSLTRAELLEEIALRLGLAISGPISKPQLMVQLERHLLAIHGQSQRAILLLDEAQNLEWDLLEEIRLLSNLEVEGVKLVQIFLVGQPELEARLSRSQMRQLRQRISVHYRLKPLSKEDTERYIHHRIAVAGAYGPRVFPAHACAEVFRLSHGIPREINHLSTQSMVNAFVEESPSVEIEHIRAAARELDFHSVLGDETLDADGTRREEPRDARPPASEVPPVAPAPEPVSEAAPGPTAPPETEQKPVEDEPEPFEAPPPAEVSDSTEEWQHWFDSLVEEPKDDGAEQKAREETHEAVVQPEVPEPQPEPPAPVVESRAEAAPAEPEPVPEPEPEREPALEPVTQAAEPAPRQPEPVVEPVAANLPPRLREKLEAQQAQLNESRRSNVPLRIMIAAGILAVLLVGAVLIQRFMLGDEATSNAATNDTGELGGVAPANAAQEPIEDVGAGAGMDTTRTPAGTTPSETTSAPGKQPGTIGTAGGAVAAQPAPTEAEPELEPEPAPAPTPTREYSVAVGTYLNEQRAIQERIRLNDSSEFDTRIMPVRDASGIMHRVVMGTFSSRTDAERAASRLIEQGLVTEARIVTVGTGSN